MVPSTGKFNIHQTLDFNTCTIAVYDLSGRLITTKTINKPQFTLDLPNGMYVIKGNTETDSFIQKIVIQ